MISDDTALWERMRNGLGWPSPYSGELFGGAMKEMSFGEAMERLGFQRVESAKGTSFIRRTQRPQPENENLCGWREWVSGRPGDVTLKMIEAGIEARKQAQMSGYFLWEELTLIYIAMRKAEKL
jgi:hypothetical protein